MTYAVTGAVTNGDLLEITGVSADSNWLQIVTADGKSGWISGQPAYTRILGSLKDIPVVEVGSGSQSLAVGGQPSAVSGQSPAVGGQPSAVGGQPSAVAFGGKLVFTTGSGGDLYVINADGTELRKLASGVIDPVVAPSRNGGPDGHQVAFTRWDEAEFGTLYVMNLDGSGERAVLGETRQAKSPTWSPDGQEIIVSFQHGGLRDPEEECRRYDFGEAVRLPENATVTGITVIGEKDTLQVCFVRAEDLQWGLRRVNLATGHYEDLPADLYSFNPTWDPQNSWRLIYDGERGLMLLDLTTGELQPFTDDARDTAPVFSPDGQKLALTYKQHDHWEVYTYDLATGSRQRLTKPPILADPQYNSAAPAWSPDGSQIAFVTDRSGRWEIWVMNADGSNQHPLFSSEAQAQLGLNYQGVNERMLNWIP
jgi:dipeptidyl aminopeptidase/acylaminoacyl peptidase